jgi:fatty acid desaturase
LSTHSSENEQNKQKNQYTPYDEVDQEELQRDIDAIKATIGAPTEEDFKHLLKLERWGYALSAFGFGMTIYLAYLEHTDPELSSFSYWIMAIIAAVALGVANVSKWANTAHPILHGAYDKVPNIPKKYTKNGYSREMDRFFHWLDWIKPEAWEYEHNIMHHYHLGEVDDPDNVEKNLQWLTQSKTPMFIRYIIIYSFAAVWKLAYYAPNTQLILENKERAKKKLPPISGYEWNPFKERGWELWRDYILPYGVVKFVLIPLLFFPFGNEGIFTAFIVMVLAELVANLHSFLVIVPNHSAEDIYMFNEPHKSQGEFYLRQIMGSVNYNTGSDLIDFMHGWLNYQVEHHLFPNLPLSQYQKMQPLVKEVCKKHGLEYRQESVFKRMLMTIDLMVGKTKLLRVDGV